MLQFRFAVANFQFAVLNFQLDQKVGNGPLTMNH